MGFPEKTASAPTLRRVMRAREYFTLAFGSIVGVGWLVVINGWLKAGGPGGAMLAFLVGGLGLIPVALVYGRLAQRLPDAGGEIAYTGAVFPRAVSFATGWVVTLSYLIVCPYEAVAVGELAAYVFPAMDCLELYRVGGQAVYLPHVLLGLGLTAAITVLNCRGMRHSAFFQNWTTYGLLAVFCIFAVLGGGRGKIDNLEPLFASGPSAADALRSTLAVLPIVPYFLMGFETIPKCSEEAVGGFDPRRFAWLMVLALAVATFFYVTVVGVVGLLVPWEELRGHKFATSIAFERAFDWKWLVQLIMFGAFLSLLKVFNGNFLSATRLFFALGRRGLIPARLGVVHEGWQTPTAAVLLVGTLTALASFLGPAVLNPIAELGSLIVLGWLATSLALCCGAGGTVTRRDLLVGVPAAGISLVLGVIVVWDFDRYQWLAVALWTGLGAALWARQAVVSATRSGREASAPIATT
jgi:basic amino acid/polyamine antiporter, APA family